MPAINKASFYACWILRFLKRFVLCTLVVFRGRLRYITVDLYVIIILDAHVPKNLTLVGQLGASLLYLASKMYRDKQKLCFFTHKQKSLIYYDRDRRDTGYDRDRRDTG